MTRKLTNDTRETFYTPQEREDGFVFDIYDARDKWIAELKDDETFHIGQGYDDFAATTLSCKICGGTEFNVGVGHCFTAIRCPKCGWEVCVHDG